MCALLKNKENYWSKDEAGALSEETFWDIFHEAFTALPICQTICLPCPYSLLSSFYWKSFLEECILLGVQYRSGRVQWTLSALVRHFLLCVSARLLYCLARTVGFHDKQATNHIKPIKRRFYLSRIWELSVVFSATIHQVGARRTFISSLARVRFSEPLQEQQTEHADATAVVVREENKLTEQSAKLCDHWQSSVHTSFI